MLVMNPTIKQAILDSILLETQTFLHPPTCERIACLVGIDRPTCETYLRLLLDQGYLKQYRGYYCTPQVYAWCRIFKPEVTNAKG